MSISSLKHLVLALPLVTGFAVTQIGCATDNDPYESHRTAGEVVDDGTITAKVKSALIDDDVVKARHIDVDTREGVVSLFGTVDSSDERRRAVEIARNTEGVRGVNDRLVVGR